MIKNLIKYAFFFHMTILADQNAFNIHVFGDSHSAFCFTNTLERNPWNHHPQIGSPESITYEQSLFNYVLNDQNLVVPFFIHWLVGRTMHRIGRDGINGFNIKNFGVKNNDYVVFIFGSIDMSNHIFRSIMKQMVNRNLDEIIETLVCKYMKTLVDNKNNFDLLHVIVFAVLPPYIHKETEREFVKLFPQQSFLKNQVNVTRKCNEKLKEHCVKHNFTFFSVNDLYETNEGDLKKELSDGWHHVNPQYNYQIKNRLITMLFNV